MVFRDERMMEHVRKITQQCCTINSSLRANVSSLLHNLHPRLTALEAYEKSLETQSGSLDENCTDISEICPNPAVLAQQLTHVELERLSFIGPEEFVQAFAKENPNLETSFKDMKKTHNLEQYVQWFNRLSYFVATQVCKVSFVIAEFSLLFLHVEYTTRVWDVFPCIIFTISRTTCNTFIFPNYSILLNGIKLFLCLVSKEENESPSCRILDRNRKGMLQHWKLQQFNGNHSWIKYVTDFKTEKNCKYRICNIVSNICKYSNF